MSLCFCADCGIPFAITQDLKDKLLVCHNTFYCPKGHQNYYPQKSDIEKERELTREKEQEIQRLRIERDDLVKQRSELLKKKRTSKLKGIIPFANPNG